LQQKIGGLYIAGRFEKGANRRISVRLKPATARVFEILKKTSCKNRMG
jgi:hypothetical protein